MRKILFFIASLATLSTMNAQVIWSDNFDDENISDWTLYDEDGDGQKWFTVQLANAPSPVLRSFSWIESLGPLTPDNWAVSPAIDLPAIDAETEAITLKWDVGAADPNYTFENYSVYVATSNAVSELSSSDVTFNELVSENGPGGVGVYYQKTLDVSSFAGETIYVAFRHHESSDVFSLEIDNVSVEVGEVGTPSEGCLEVNPARPQYPYTTQTPSCTGELEVFATLARTGEYTKMNVFAGTTYTFTSSVATDFVTIANADGTEILAYGDSGLTWTSDADQEIRYYLHLDNNCNWSGTATRAKRVQCSILPEPEGCLEADNGQYPTAAYIPSCIGLAESITGGDYGYFGEYSMVNVTEGTEYTFSALSIDVPTVFITIGNEAGTEVLISGTDTVTWTATETGAVRFYTHENDECLASNNWVDRIVQCGEALPPPANDECDGAIALACGDTETGTTVFANNSGGNESNDVFFSFVGDGTEQMVTLSLCGSSYDTAISVYSDCSLTNLVASNDDSANCPEFQSEVTFLSDGTTNYIIVVEGYSFPLFGITDAGEFELTVTCEELPEFDACEPVFTGGADYAIGFSGGDAIAANDINVLADTQFSVEKITFDVNTYGGAPTTFDVTFYEGENGVETPYGEAFEGLTPTSMEITGTYAGDPTYTVELTLPTTQILPATATEDKKYWIAISSDLATDDNFTYWVSSTYLFTETLPTWQSLDGGITWEEVVDDFGVSYEGIMSIEGECSDLGISDLSSFDFTYYPNPVKDVLNISAKKNVESVSVFNLAGQKVVNNAKVSNGQIDVNALTAGTYVFRITLEGGQVETFKIIKK